MGQLGFSEYSYDNYYHSPRMIKYQVYIKNISCGFEHILFQTEFGNVYVTGSNKKGQLGLINYEKRSTPTRINIFKNKKEKAWKISAGAYYSLIYTDSGCIYGFGCNKYKQLGEYNKLNINIKSDTNENKNINILDLKMILNNNKIIEIKSGKNHSGFLLDNGEVFTWGSNKYNQLGRKDIDSYEIQKIDNFENIIKLSFGYEFSMFIDKEGELFVCGNNEEGHLGFENREIIIKPQKINLNQKVKKAKCSNFLTCITEDYDLYIWGNSPIGFKSKPFLITSLEGLVSDIACGEDYFLLSDIDKFVYSFGKNSTGQLGLGNNLTINDIKKIDSLTDQITYLFCGKDFSIGWSGINLERFENKTLDNSMRSNYKLLENNDLSEDKSDNKLIIIYNKIKNTYLKQIENILIKNKDNTVEQSKIEQLNNLEEIIIEKLTTIGDNHSNIFMKKKLLTSNKKQELLNLKTEFEKNLMPSNYSLIYKEYLKSNEHLKDNKKLKNYKKQLKSNNDDIDDCINKINEFFN